MIFQSYLLKYYPEQTQHISKGCNNYAFGLHFLSSRKRNGL